MSVTWKLKAQYQGVGEEWMRICQDILRDQSDIALRELAELLLRTIADPEEAV